MNRTTLVYKSENKNKSSDPLFQMHTDRQTGVCVGGNSVNIYSPFHVKSQLKRGNKPETRSCSVIQRDSNYSLETFVCSVANVCSRLHTFYRWQCLAVLSTKAHASDCIVWGATS